MEVSESETVLESLTIEPGVTLRETLAAIQHGGAQICFVADRDGRLVGSVSDGDVRRALLAGAELGDKIEPYVNQVPVSARPDDDVQEVAALMERNGVAQIPVVDGEGRLVGVHLMKAIVGKHLDRVIQRGGF